MGLREEVSMGRSGEADGRTFILTADLCCEFDEFQRVELVLDRADEAT
jgi:hypothetical protein